MGILGIVIKVQALSQIKPFAGTGLGLSRVEYSYDMMHITLPDETKSILLFRQELVLIISTFVLHSNTNI